MRSTSTLVILSLSVVFSICITACKKSQSPSPGIIKDTVNTSVLLPSATGFNKTIDGKQTRLYLLKNKNNATAAITNYGARLVALLVPDKTDTLRDVVMGFDSIAAYKQAGGYYGATLGRYAHRIAGGKFKLDGTEYTLFLNSTGNTLHGGKIGFDSKVWDARQIDSKTLELEYISNDLEEGFPGTLHAKVTYTLGDDNALKISYQATTDKTTVVNLSNHIYFNLNGLDGSSILNHLVKADADNYLSVGTNKLPTGLIGQVAGTPLDFTSATLIGARIAADHPQIKIAKGYDTYLIFNTHSATAAVASAQADKSGIKMEVFTTEPGMEFYTSNSTPGTHTFFGGKKDVPHSSFAMETIHYPDSPNQSTFPSTVLKPGELYKTQTIYKFSVVK
jgi:aldose 1-epimerase